jgi:hypothetical protein
VPVADEAIGELSNACLNYLSGFGKAKLQRRAIAAMQYPMLAEASPAGHR